MTEFGFQSFPSQQVLDYIVENKQLDLNDGAIKSHQKHHRGFQLIDEYMARDFPVPTKVEDYAYVSQLVQARGMRMGIEAHRRAKPYNMGTLFWQLNDCWPAISWSSIDYLGQSKALHYATREAFKNVLISFEREDDIINVYIVNDHLYPINETLELLIQNFQGEQIQKKHIAVEVSSNSSQLVYSLALDNLEIDTKDSFLKASMKSANGLFYFERPKNINLNDSEIDMKVTQQADGYSILLKSETLHKSVRVSADNQGFFEDNYFDLLPNQEKQIHFTTNEIDVMFQIVSLNTFQ